MSKKTTLELLEDNLNKHMEVCDLKRKVKKLQAKNERLRKAGSALALLQSPTNYSPEQVKLQCVLDWVNAVEGLDAK